MSEQDFIIHRSATLQLAMAGIGALVIIFGMWAATQAEKHYAHQALVNQENVSWK